MIPIRIEDFKDLIVHIIDPMCEIDDPFAELIKLRAYVPRLAQLRGRPKKKRIQKAAEGKPKREIRYSYCQQIGHNRKGCRNRRKVPIVDISSEGSKGGEGSEESDNTEDTSA